jgi:glycosyltransferase involved in cell wall biosynthesis
MSTMTAPRAANVEEQLPSLLVAIPCLNEAVTIGSVVASVPRRIAGVGRVDVLVVDDGSSDQTCEIAQRSGALVLRHPRNRGLGIAFQSAVSYAIQHGYQIMLNIDGDGQFSAADIPALVAPILGGQADMVTASRFKDPSRVPDMPRAKLIGNHMMSYLVSKLVGVRYHDVSCGFRCYSREALLRINLHGRFTYTQETFLDLSAKDVRIEEIPVDVRYFADRKSRVARKLVPYALHTALIIFRSYRDYFPLRFFCFMALLFAVPATLAAAFFFFHFAVTGRFSGYLYVGFTAAFLYAVSAMFLVLAIVTDMLDRIRANQDRILYLLKRDSMRTDTLLPPERQR